MSCALRFLFQTASFVNIVDMVITSILLLLWVAMPIYAYFVAERHYGTGVLWFIIVSLTHVLGFIVFVVIHTYYSRHTVKSTREIRSEINEERYSIVYNFYNIKDQRLFDVARVDHEIEQVIKTQGAQAALLLAKEKFKSNDCDFELMRAYIEVLEDECDRVNPTPQTEEWY